MRMIELSCCAIALLSPGVLRAEGVALLRLELKDGIVSPQRLEAPAGKAFQLEIRNTGKGAAEFESKALKKEKVLVPGATVVISFNAMPAGEYKFVEEFHENLPTGQGFIVLN